MTTKKTTKDLTPSPLLDASGNPSAVAAGQIIESAWGNSVAGRVVNRYPSKAAMDAVAGVEGQLAVVAGIVYIRDGGVWRPSGAGRRVLFRTVGGGGQLVPVGTVTTVTYTTEIADAFGVVSAGVFTVPTGWNGLWQFDWSVGFAASGTGIRQVFLTVGSNRYGSDTRVAASGQPVDMPGAATVLMNAGETAQVQVYQTLETSGLVTNASANNYFQGHYVGTN